MSEHRQRLVRSEGYDHDGYMVSLAYAECLCGKKFAAEDVERAIHRLGSEHLPPGGLTVRLSDEQAATYDAVERAVWRGDT